MPGQGRRGPAGWRRERGLPPRIRRTARHDLDARGSLPMFSKFFARPVFGGGCLGVACALVVWSLGHASSLTALEDWALDTCFVHRGSRTTSARVVIVAIDD